MNEIELGETHVAADWRRVGDVYEQCSIAVSDSTPYLPPPLTAFLSELVARQSASYYGHQGQFVRDASKCFLGAPSDSNESALALYADSRFRALPEYGLDSDLPRRRPTPFEAVVETARRLRDLETIESAISGLTVGALLGGSASYGRFFNVLGAVKGSASDIDLLIVVKEHADFSEVINRLSGLPFVSNEDADLQVKRFGQFLIDRNQIDTPMTFSGKLGLWINQSDPILDDLHVSPRYDLSMHVMQKDDFGQLILKHAARLDKEAIGSEKLISDYRETEPVREDHQRNFAGRNLRLKIKTSPLGDSFVRRSHIFAIDEDGCYFPGMLQNLVLPQFYVRWGESGFRRDVEAFRWKMVERLRFEQKTRPNQFLRLSLCHTRSEIFAPHAIRSVDQNVVLP